MMNTKNFRDWLILLVAQMFLHIARMYHYKSELMLTCGNL